MTRAVLLTCLVLAGCGRGAGGTEKAKGTSADPVEVCERLGDVCKLDSSRLGVCSPPKEGTALVCAPQH
jgi:hypothetical protein